MLDGSCFLVNKIWLSVYSTDSGGGGGTRFVAAITVCYETDTPDLGRPPWHARQPSSLNPCSTITHILYPHTLKCVNYNYEPYASILHIIMYVWKMFYQLNHFIVI